MNSIFYAATDIFVNFNLKGSEIMSVNLSNRFFRYLTEIISSTRER